MTNKKTIKDVDQKLELHLKDYTEVRKDVDGILEWLLWIAKILIGAIILSILALIGLKS